MTESCFTCINRAKKLSEKPCNKCTFRYSEWEGIETKYIDLLNKISKHTTCTDTRGVVNKFLAELHDE